MCSCTHSCDSCADSSWSMKPVPDLTPACTACGVSIASLAGNAAGHAPMASLVHEASVSPFAGSYASKTAAGPAMFSPRFIDLILGHSVSSKCLSLPNTCVNCCAAVGLRAANLGTAGLAFSPTPVPPRLLRTAAVSGDAACVTLAALDIRPVRYCPHGEYLNPRGLLRPLATVNISQL